MIDVVFVIMLFFMVMAGAVKVENELNTQLPGTAETSASTDFVDEQIITISDTGEISLNDEPFDSATSKDLPKLKGTLMRLKQNADAAKTPAVVTIISDTQAKYSRTIDVLDALAVAKIDNVTFTRSGRRVAIICSKNREKVLHPASPAQTTAASLVRRWADSAARPRDRPAPRSYKRDHFPPSSQSSNHRHQ